MSTILMNAQEIQSRNFCRTTVSRLRPSKMFTVNYLCQKNKKKKTNRHHQHRLIFYSFGFVPIEQFRFQKIKTEKYRIANSSERSINEKNKNTQINELMREDYSISRHDLYRCAQFIFSSYLQMIEVFPIAYQSTIFGRQMKKLQCITYFQTPDDGT